MNTFPRLRYDLSILVAALCLAVSATAHAQSVAGTVRDTSGAVLPGVSVEAASPALIERSRSVVTDANGQYQIIDLRPGAYTITFTLQGFTTVIRQDVTVTGSGVTTINGDMRLGGLQETITVTGDSPVVDVQTSTSREQVLSDEFVRSLPASRGYGNYLAGVPGINGTGLGASATPSNNFFSSRGGRSSEGNVQIDGMNVGASVGGGGVSGYQYDMFQASEVQVTIAGGLAEVDRGGPAFNMIPKTGGNSFSGMYYGSLAGEWAQGSNLDAELRSFDFADLPALIKNWDTSFCVQRPHPPRPHLVLQQRANGGHTPGRAEPVRQPERGGSERVDLRPRRQREGPQRHCEANRCDAAHLAGVAEAQARVLPRLHAELLRFLGDQGRRTMP